MHMWLAQGAHRISDASLSLTSDYRVPSPMAGMSVKTLLTWSLHY
jgi:hypothetical protein